MTDIAIDLFTPPLEERVLVISLWQPYACLSIAGIKLLETREWEWPYPPRWLVIHASKRAPSAADEQRLAAKLARVPAPLREARGALLGLVYVAGPSRPLLPEDEPAACFYKPGRFAWPLEQPTPFARPVPVERGPQKFSSLPRADVLRFVRGEPAQEVTTLRGDPALEHAVLAACHEITACHFNGRLLGLDDRFPGDSLHRVEAELAAEEALGVEIPNEDSTAWTTPRELMAIVERALARKGTAR